MLRIADPLPESVGPEKLVRSFLSGRKPTTLRTYSRSLREFADWLGCETLPESAGKLFGNGPGHANSLAHDYKSWLIEKGCSSNTINARLTALRAFVKLARVMGLVSWKLDVSNVKSKPYRDTRGPGEKWFRSTVAQLESDGSPMALRNLAMLRLLHDLALRREEVVSLDLSDVDLEQGVLWLTVKGDTEKSYRTLPKPTARALHLWICSRGSDEGPLFTNFDPCGKGRRLTGNSLYRIVRSLGEAAGVSARPHGLRHTAITEALEKTKGDVVSVAAFSGHKNLRTLLIYNDNRMNAAGEVANLVAE